MGWQMMGWHWHQLDHVQIICISLQTDYHASTSLLNILQGRMLFLTFNQQCQSTEGTELRAVMSYVIFIKHTWSISCDLVCGRWCSECTHRRFLDDVRCTAAWQRCPAVCRRRTTRTARPVEETVSSLAKYLRLIAAENFNSITRHRASTSTRWHFAFGVMLS